MSEKVFLDELKAAMDKVAKEAEALVASETPIKTKDIAAKTHSTNAFKNGIYFALDKGGEVIYIGKVGSGKKTSLYHRFKGHGSGAHKRRLWYKYCKTVKFHKFDISDGLLKVIESALILKKNPKYDKSMKETVSAQVDDVGEQD